MTVKNDSIVDLVWWLVVVAFLFGWGAGAATFLLVYKVGFL
jgi:hypothetical protein